MLDSYYKQAKEREQIGVVPKPLSASDVEELIAVLQDPGAESREELLNLIENRIPPGVDEAAKVKAAFLNDLATGRKTSPVLSKQKAVELLGTMQGGYNVQYLLDLLKDEQLAQTAADALKHILLIFDSFNTVADLAKNGNKYAKEVIESWADCYSIQGIR